MYSLRVFTDSLMIQAKPASAKGGCFFLVSMLSVNSEVERVLHETHSSWNGTCNGLFDLFDI